MAYVKQTWETGQTITADKLNHIEDGVANSGGFLITANYDADLNKTILDKTWKEIKDMMGAGVACVIFEPYDESEFNWYTIRQLTANNGSFSLLIANDTDYYAATENDYPAHSWG